jgi:hypothetical protein
MREKMSVDFLGAILRLGKKYDIGYLCEEGLRRLRLEFPTTLEQWYICYRECIHIESYSKVAMTILGLCYELSIHRCLPVAYFLAATSYTLVSSPLHCLLLLINIIVTTRNVSWEVLWMVEEFWSATW